MQTLIEKSTSLGKISVSNSSYSEDLYPGYSVCLTSPSGKVLAEVLFEVDETEAPECKIHIYESEKEEPVCSFYGRSFNDKMSLRQENSQ